MARRNPVDKTANEVVSLLAKSTFYKQVFEERGQDLEDRLRTTLLTSKVFHYEKIEIPSADISVINDSNPEFAVGDKKSPIIIDINTGGRGAPSLGAPSEYIVILGSETWRGVHKRREGEVGVYLGDAVLERARHGPVDPGFTAEDPHPKVDEQARAFWHTLVDYAEDNPTQLWALLGFDAEDFPKVDIDALSARRSGKAIEILVGLLPIGAGREGEDQIQEVIDDVRSRLRKRGHVRVAPPQAAEPKYVVTLTAYLADGLWQVVSRSMEEGMSLYFQPRRFRSERAPYDWELVVEKDPSLERKVKRAWNKAISDVDNARVRRDRNLERKAQGVIDSILVYRDLPSRQVQGRRRQERRDREGYRPRLPSGSRPDLPWSEDDCFIVQDMARQLGCQVQGGVVSDSRGTKYPYDIMVIDARNLVLSHGYPGLQPNTAYPSDFRAKDLSGEKGISKVDSLRENFVVETLLLPSSDAQSGIPVVWNNIVVSGNARLLAFFMSSSSEHAKYGEYLRYLTGYEGSNGILVRRLRGVSRANVLSLIKGSRDKRPNPVLIVGNPSLWGGIKNMFGFGKRKNRSDESFVKNYPEDAIPIKKIPTKIRRHPSFSASVKEFKKRYGAEPDYAIWVDAPKGVSPVLTAVGQLKQIDYLAAESAKNPAYQEEDLIHWYHEAGERGEGVPYTRAAIVASDALDNSRVILVEPPGSRMRFTNRGIVG